MKLIAFYLPQFHRIPENDEWWGEGFTEWVSVARSRPLFSGHDHPRVPTDLGEYDLTGEEPRVEQSALARLYGVDAFCMYFYWFDGKRLLEKPLEAWRQNPELLPYCLSWANEAWTRTWDGRNRSVLMPQSYPDDYVSRVFDEMLPHFQAPHYVRVSDVPVLLVHRADLIPDPHAFSSDIRARAVAAGLGGIYLVASETKPDIDPRAFGFDAVAEFPPVSASRLRNAQLRPVQRLDKAFRGRLLSYDRVARFYMERAEPGFVRHRGVMPSWDNTARRGHKSTVYVGHAPASYQAWLAQALRSESRGSGDDQGLVFVNAWNEWAEGAYLEPDETHGRAYLEATLAARQGLVDSGRGAPSPRGLSLWSWGHLQSLLRLSVGSVLVPVRRWRYRVRDVE